MSLQGTSSRYALHWVSCRKAEGPKSHGLPRHLGIQSNNRQKHFSEEKIKREIPFNQNKHRRYFKENFICLKIVGNKVLAFMEVTF